MTRTSFSFQVKGTPTPWKRAGRNTFRRGSGSTFDTQKRIKRLIQDECALAMRSAGVKRAEKGVPVELSVMAYFQVPPSLSKKEKDLRIDRGDHTQVPDADNLAKLIKDALNGVAYVDDCQVSTGFQQKRWTMGGARTTVQIKIKNVETV